MSIAKFRDPQTQYEESIQHAGLWCLLFGSIYFAVKGVWSHAVVSFVLAVSTATISWFVYPFFARGILERHCQRKGWIPVDVTGQSAGGFRKCPFCAETIRSEALVCKFCRSDLSAAPAAPNFRVDVPAATVQPRRAGTPARPRSTARLVFGLLALVLATASSLTYWLFVEPAGSLDEVYPKIIFIGFVTTVVVLSVGCVWRRRWPGLAELGFIFAWHVIGGAAWLVASVQNQSPSKPAVDNKQSFISPAKPRSSAKGQGK